MEEQRQRAAPMATALARLPAAQREAVLFEVDGFSSEEITQMRGDPVSAGHHVQLTLAGWPRRCSGRSAPRRCSSARRGRAADPTTGGRP